MLQEKIRSIAFWLLDYLRGARIKRKYRYLESIQAGKNGINEEALKEILSHAIHTVPFYKKSIEVPDIVHFPVVSKAIIKENYNDFRSEQYLDNSKLHEVHTSGSTGTPFTAYQDEEKTEWHKAGLILLNERIGWSLGMKYLAIRVWGLGHKATWYKRTSQNMIAVPVTNFDVDQKRRICDKLQKKKISVIIGYSSAIVSLSHFILSQKIDTSRFHLKLIVASADSLSNEDKELVERVFNCSVFNRYGNNENGIIAISNSNDNSMNVNTAEYYVEILKLNSNERCKVGEIGRVVITDLYNKAFPFIRYDTGDLGVLKEERNGQCISLSSFEGRISTALTTTKGELLSEVTVAAYYKMLVEIKRYQIVQERGKYIILLEKTKTDIDKTVIEASLKCFGEDANIEIRHVEKIPTGKSGKFHLTQNRTNG